MTEVKMKDQGDGEETESRLVVQFENEMFGRISISSEQTHHEYAHVMLSGEQLEALGKMFLGHVKGSPKKSNKLLIKENKNISMVLLTRTKTLELELRSAREKIARLQEQLKSSENPVKCMEWALGEIKRKYGGI